jgi:DUF971 family protein
MKPISIKKANSADLVIIWESGHESRFTLEHLRNICPCANCQGEELLLRHVPPRPRTNTSGHYQLVGIQPIGSYAVQLRWGDGHDAGIYSWDHLLENCRCEICANGKN